MEYFGTVEDIEDPLKLSRVRVRVKGVFDKIPTEHIPWSSPRYLGKNTHDLPHVGSLCYIVFIGDDIMFPRWYTKQTVDLGLSDEDYKSSNVLINKDLSLYESDGHVDVRFEESVGLSLAFTYNDKRSEFIIRPDNSIYIQNGDTEHIVHMSSETISLGSETRSAEPAVLGDTNNEALDMTNDTIDNVKSITNDYMTQLATTASASPYTAPLAPLFTQFALEITTTITQMVSDNDAFYPSTKSEIVSLD